MSYFKGLKLTKKGEQLQAKINGNLSETLNFTRAKLGSGTIVSDDEVRFLTDLKESWGEATISKCTLENENTMVAIELQFSNAELSEDKIFREIGLYAQGNDGEEVLYAYSNAGDNYDYIPLMQESPHSFIVTIYFTVTSGAKINANIDLNSYISIRQFNKELSQINASINNKVSKSGDTMTGDLTIRKNMPYIAFNDTRTEEGGGYIGFGSSTTKKMQIVNRYSDGITEIMAPNLETQSKEVIEAINEVNNIKEPKFNKNTAFNKNFGTKSGTVAEGNKVEELNRNKLDKVTTSGLVGFENGQVGLFIGGGNEINFKTHNNRVVFNYRTVGSTEKTIESFSFYGGAGDGRTYADIYAKNLFNDGNQVWHAGNFKPFEIKQVWQGKMTNLGKICDLPNGWLVCYVTYSPGRSGTEFILTLHKKVGGEIQYGHNYEIGVKMIADSLTLTSLGPGEDGLVKRVVVLI